VRTEKVAGITREHIENKGSLILAVWRTFASKRGTGQWVGNRKSPIYSPAKVREGGRNKKNSLQGL
jgi:hypothetical protein